GEERRQRIALPRRVGDSEIDEVSGVTAVEIEVREEIGLSSGVLGGVAKEDARKPGARLRSRAPMREALGGDYPEVPRRSEKKVADDAVGGATALDDRLVDAHQEVVTVDPAPLLENRVEQSQSVRVVVDAIEEKRVQYLAREKGGAADALFRNRRMRATGAGPIVQA